MSFFMANAHIIPLAYELITHAHIPPQHMLLFATRMGNISMFLKFFFLIII